LPQDDEPVLQLREILDSIYEKAALNLEIDYSGNLYRCCRRKMYSEYSNYLT